MFASFDDRYPRLVFQHYRGGMCPTGCLVDNATHVEEGAPKTFKQAHIPHDGLYEDDEGSSGSLYQYRVFSGKVNFVNYATSEYNR
jgi:hypothetical protein